MGMETDIAGLVGVAMSIVVIDKRSIYLRMPSSLCRWTRS